MQFAQTNPVRLLIVERQPVVTPEVRNRLSREPSFALVGRVSSAVEATRFMRDQPLDMVLVESTLPEPGAVEIPEAVETEALGPLFVKLSPREIEILDLVARGNSNKIIGRKLSISDQTVKNHVSAILRKLEVNDRTEAVVYALRNGWIRIETPAT